MMLQTLFKVSIASLSVVITTETALAATFTYDINRVTFCSPNSNCTGEVTVTGTITTDTLGQLSKDNFVDWMLNFNSSNYGDNLLTPINSQVVDFGFGTFALVEATPTQLLFTSPPLGGPESILTIDSTEPSSDIVWQLRGGGVTALEVINNDPIPLDGIFDQGFADVEYGVTLVIGNSQSQTSVSESTSIISLLTLGTLVAGSVLKRKLKPSKLTEKELEKVS